MFTMNAKEYNEKVMNGYFKDIYPVIAAQIVERTQVTQGKCIDLGGGPGMLGISIAKITGLQVTIYDLLKDCVDLVAGNSMQNGVSDRVDAIQDRAEVMNCFKDNTIDLVVSRGSIFFWDDIEKGISEVERILKPGGWAYIGGGFGTAKLKKQIMAQMDDEAYCKKNSRSRAEDGKRLQEVLTHLRIKGCIEKSEAGIWMIFQKRNEL